MLSFQSLRTPVTSTEATETILDVLRSLGFETTGWVDGTIQLTLIKLVAILYSDISEAVALTASNSLNSTASGEGLTDLSASHFDNTRVRAVKTAGPALLTSTARIPYTIEVGQLIAATVNGVEFRNTTGGVLAAAGTLSLEWEARLAGETGNVALGQLNTLLTPLAGVTIANSSGTPWYTTTGADAERDAVLQLRNSTKWARMTVELVRESYINTALDNGARKVAVDDQNPRGAGTIDVIVAGDRTLLAPDVLEAIHAAFYERTFQTDETHPASATSRVKVLDPTPYDLAVAATVYHDASVDGATIVARCIAALEDFLTLTPIGGWDYTPGPANVIAVADLYDVLKGVEGVRTVVMTVPAANVSVGTLALVRAAGTWSSTIVPVPVAA
jgi:hypothetical protein